MGASRSRNTVSTALYAVSDRYSFLQHPPTQDELVSSLWPFLFLEVLHDSMSVKSVCNFSTKLEIDTGTRSISRHQGRVHLHLLLGIAISTLSIPIILVLTFFAGFRVQLEW